MTKEEQEFKNAAFARMRDPDMYLSDAVIDEMSDALLKMAEWGVKWKEKQIERMRT